MSLAFATPPSNMKLAELATEAFRLRRRRQTTSLTPGEQNRLESLETEMNNRQSQKRK